MHLINREKSNGPRIEPRGSMLMLETGDQRSKSYLKGRISMATQKCNAASILGTFHGNLRNLIEIFQFLGNLEIRAQSLFQ